MPGDIKVSVVVKEKRDETLLELQSTPNYTKPLAFFCISQLVVLPMTLTGDFVLTVAFLVFVGVVALVAKFGIESLFSGSFRYVPKEELLSVSEGFGTGSSASIGAQTLVFATTELKLEDGSRWFLDRVQFKRAGATKATGSTIGTYEMNYAYRLFLLGPDLADVEQEAFEAHQEKLNSLEFSNVEDAPSPEGAKLFLTSREADLLLQLAPKLSQVTGASLLDLALMGGPEAFKAHAAMFPIENREGWRSLRGLKLQRKGGKEIFVIRGMHPFLRLFALAVMGCFLYFVILFFKMTPALSSTLIFFGIVGTALLLDTKLVLHGDKVQKEASVLGLFTIFRTHVSWYKVRSIVLLPDREKLYYVVLKGAEGQKDFSIGVNGLPLAEWIFRYLLDIAARR